MPPPEGFPSPYLLTLAAILWLPLFALRRFFFAGVDRRAAAAATAAIAAIGWSWSAFLSWMGWWSFPGAWIVHPVFLRHLPFEEAAFYPTAALFIIGVHNAASRARPGRRGRGSGAAYEGVLLAGTAGFLLLCGVYADRRPYYLLSQIVVFNALAVLLRKAIRPVLNPFAMAATTGLLAVIGFAWDAVAFRFGLWAYHATIGLRIDHVPIDDFNFFMFATPAGLSVYLAFLPRRQPAAARGRDFPGGRAGAPAPARKELSRA